MGVYIKGMDMPNECVECIFNVWCAVYRMNEWDYKGGRLDNCPLVEVPEPHGRLIDADALLNTSFVTINITGKENAMIVTQALDSIYEDIADAPTVIEAEVE